MEGDIIGRPIAIKFGAWGLVVGNCLIYLLGSLLLVLLILLSYKTKSRIKRVALHYFALFGVYTAIFLSTGAVASWWSKLDFIEDFGHLLFRIIFPISYYYLFHQEVSPGFIFGVYGLSFYFTGICYGVLLTLIHSLISFLISKVKTSRA